MWMGACNYRISCSMGIMVAMEGLEIYCEGGKVACLLFISLLFWVFLLGVILNILFSSFLVKFYLFLYFCVILCIPSLFSSFPASPSVYESVENIMDFLSMGKFSNMIFKLEADCYQRIGK